MCVRWTLIFPLRMWRRCAGDSRGNIACKSRRPERRRRPRRPLPGPCAFCVFGPLSLATKKERLVQHAVIVYGAFPAAGGPAGHHRRARTDKKRGGPSRWDKILLLSNKVGQTGDTDAGAGRPPIGARPREEKSTHAGPTVHGFLKGTDACAGNPLQSPLISQIFDPAAGSLSRSPAPVSLRLPHPAGVLLCPSGTFGPLSCCPVHVCPAMFVLLCPSAFSRAARDMSLLSAAWAVSGNGHGHGRGRGRGHSTDTETEV